MKHPSRKRKKYKRLMAALAGAAVVSSALLPGIPINKAHAAVAPTPAATYTTADQANDQADSQKDKDKPQDNERGRWNKDRDEWNGRYDRDRHDHDRYSHGYRLSDPVEVVRNNASTFGFDASRDRFSLLSITGSTAIVQVKTSVQTFKVDLKRSNGDWVVTTVRGIGNNGQSATYRPASSFGYSTLGVSTSVPTSQTTLYSTDKLLGWSWQEGAYPQGMAMGVFLTQPKSVNIIPDNIRTKLSAVDFDRQFVLYTHLGAVSSKGYGIGIEKVVQKGNDLTVTVRTNSPRFNTNSNITQGDDYVTLNRGSLDFTSTIHITFVDVHGATLSNYTITQAKTIY